MYCTQDCTCSLCRELRGFKLNKLHQQQQQLQQQQQQKRNKNGDNNDNKDKDKDNKKKSIFQRDSKQSYPSTSHSQHNDNFILKRRLSDINEPDIDYHNSSNLNKTKTKSTYDNYSNCKSSDKKIFAMKKAQSCNEINKKGVVASLSAIGSTAAAGGTTTAAMPNINNVPIGKFYKNSSSSNNKNNNGGHNKLIRSAMNLTESKYYEDGNNFSQDQQQQPPGHKTVIYFGDSMQQQRGGGSKTDASKNENADVYHAALLLEETGMLKRQNSTRIRRTKDTNISKQKSQKDTPAGGGGGNDFMKQLKSVLEEKHKIIEDDKEGAIASPVPDKSANLEEDEVDVNDKSVGDATDLPPYIDSIINGVINIKIEGNYETATRIVKSVTETTKHDAIDLAHNSTANDADDEHNFDWSFVQEWRARLSSNSRNDLSAFNITSSNLHHVNPNLSHHSAVNGGANGNSCGGVITSSSNANGISPGSHYIASSNPVASSTRIQSPAIATPATRATAKELALRPIEQKSLNLSNYNLAPISPNINNSNINLNNQNNNHGDNNNNLNSNSNNLSNNGLCADEYNHGSGGIGAQQQQQSQLQHQHSQHHQIASSSAMIPERDVGPNKVSASSSSSSNCKPITHRAIAGPARLTIQSTPVKYQPAMVSSGLDKSNTSLNNSASKSSPSNLNASNNNSMSNNSSNNGLNNSSSATSADFAENENSLKHPQISHHQIQSHHQQQQQTHQPQPHQQHQQSLHQPQQQPHQQQQHHSMNSHQKSSLGITRTHHHAGTHDFRGLQRVNECHSSSDENRSSGHASMSDTGHGSSSPGGVRNIQLGPLPEDRLAAGVTNKSARSRASTGHSRSRHRGTPAKIPWGGGGLEDIKLAIQQLTMRSHTSTSTYSSLSAGSESSEPARRLGRYSSLETVNTNVTSADEFVWVDSHNRLVELQHPPWSQHCVLRVIRTGRCREQADRVSAEAVPRLGYLLQRALVRVAREVQRLSSAIGLCSKSEVAGAFKIVLCPALADSCIKACLRAAAMFAVPGDSALRQSKSSRAGLQLPVGRFHRWMADARLGRFVHEYAAVYLCAGLENLLEEILLQCLNTDTSASLTATGLEHAIASSGDLWGLLQPYAHLNAGRIASGALTMPRWASQSSIGSGSTGQSHSSPALEPCLLTTCVGSLAELRDLVNRSQQRSQHITLSQSALRALFYFMRCSQLEHNEIGATSNGNNSIQELCYERAYVVLPPLVEWLRVASAHAEYRHAILIDKDDIMQAARLLLPGVDCPTRPLGSEEELPSKKLSTSYSTSTTQQQLQGSLSSSVSSNSSNYNDDSSECGRRATIALAFRLMLTGRAELLLQALSLVSPTTRYDTLNHEGLTALMIAAVRNDEAAIQTLLDSGADPNIEVPAVGHPNCGSIHPETQFWTALTFASCRGNFQSCRLLLERGAHVEGGGRLSEDKCTLTPLQVASGSGNLDIVSLLLAHGAHAFLSTQQKDTLCFAGTAQRGCFSAISVAAAHGQRISLRKLLSHPLAPGSREVLSLEEMLAEGDGNTRSPLERQSEAPPTLNKTQIKSLQEAMYHSAENNHLDITIELRALGVPWTLHCWMHALAAAHELRLDAVIDQLLQDFLQVCPDDYSQQFVTECLPLLFNIFRYSKKEGTTLLLADIFSTCFGYESIKPIKEPVLQPINGSRIDPKFVNNPELSDVTFRVEGRIFYGHKIVLVTGSHRLQSMLSSKINEGNSTPTVQINDIRYHIFELVMQFLYSGGCSNLDVASNDVLELMAAASFFQLEGLLRYTEARCAKMIDIDNVVAMYIHAKVYSAPKLMEYCQGFLLQNMVALLTYDDSVKRLLFAKKIPNHDVLNGLLNTLQVRIKRRSSQQNPLNISRPATVLAANINNSNNIKIK